MTILTNHTESQIDMVAQDGQIHLNHIRALDSDDFRTRMARIREANSRQALFVWATTSGLSGAVTFFL